MKCENFDILHNALGRGGKKTMVDSKGVAAESGSSWIAVSCFESLVPEKWSQNAGTRINHPTSIHGPPLTGNAIKM